MTKEDKKANTQINYKKAQHHKKGPSKAPLREGENPSEKRRKDQPIGRTTIRGSPILLTHRDPTRHPIKLYRLQHKVGCIPHS
jgi:hypothetical protein